MVKTRLLDTWPNGRPFKHGAMEIHFIFRPASRISAEADVEAAMEDLLGYTRGKEYHIPGWNYPSACDRGEFWKQHLTLTFNDDETFVMTKLMWGINDTSGD